MVPMGYVQLSPDHVEISLSNDHDDLMYMITHHILYIYLITNTKTKVRIKTKTTTQNYGTQSA